MECWGQDFKGVSAFSLLIKLQLNIFYLCALTLTALMANSADNLIIFFPENRSCYFMQIVSIRDKLHTMSNPVSW